jgi:hypothetical protein
MIVRPIPRRTLLRGAGVAMALPLLEAMLPRRASAQADVPRRFVAYFVPNGTDPGQWHPAGEGPLTAADLKPCLADMTGFAAEWEWPASQSILGDVTLVSGVNHQPICTAIHSPAMALAAHADGGEPSVPKAPTLDQYLAEHIGGVTPYRNLNFSATNDTEITQGYLSFRAAGQTDDVLRNPSTIFNNLFRDLSSPTDELEAIRARKQSVLDYVKEDAARLGARLGAADKMRVDQYLQSVSELEKQIQGSVGTSCTIPSAPASGGNMHVRFKQMVDLAVLALACDLTRVITLQASNSWGLDYAGYDLGENIGSWSDHFISHKLGDQDRATDLDGLPQAEARRIADARVILTSRFKVRRFAYFLNAMKSVATPTGTLLDESLVLYTSENGDGDSHGRQNMPIILAGPVGGFATGRRVAAGGAPTGALHCSIINRFGIELAQYGNPASGPIPGL